MASLSMRGNIDVTPGLSVRAKWRAKTFADGETLAESNSASAFCIPVLHCCTPRIEAISSSDIPRERRSAARR